MVAVDQVDSFVFTVAKNVRVSLRELFERMPSGTPVVVFFLSHDEVATVVR